MTNKYKVMFYDRDLETKYPVTIIKNNISDLCRWLNEYTVRWNLEVIHAQLLDFDYRFVSTVALLPEEISIQHFITSLPKRLIAYNEFVNGGV